MFIMSIVSRFEKNLELDHFSAIVQILRYLAGSLEKNITFKRESKFNLIRYLDFD